MRVATGLTNVPPSLGESYTFFVLLHFTHSVWAVTLGDQIQLHSATAERRLESAFSRHA